MTSRVAFAIAGFAVGAVFPFILPNAVAQEVIPTIGFLHPGSYAGSARVASFVEGLKDLGYVDGRNIVIEWRFAEGNRGRLSAMAADLARRKVAVIVCPGSAAGAAVDATRTIPIVVTVATGYVDRGWARSLRRPGGNVTGLSTQAAGLMGKQLELLKESVPSLVRVAILAFSGNAGHMAQIREAKDVAPVLGLDVRAAFVGKPEEFPAAFARMKADGVDGVVVLRHGNLVQWRNQMAALARKAHLPSMFGHGREAEAGGLMSYGADTATMFYDAASYVDKILKGADPAELPISQSRKFNLVVNLQTAKALGITFPPSILLRADRVVE